MCAEEKAWHGEEPPVPYRHRRRALNRPRHRPASLAWTSSLLQTITTDDRFLLLSPRAQSALLVAVIRRADRGGTFWWKSLEWATAIGIRAAEPESKQRVLRAVVQELEDHRLLECEPCLRPPGARQKGAQGSNTYRLAADLVAGADSYLRACGTRTNGSDPAAGGEMSPGAQGRTDESGRARADAFVRAERSERNLNGRVQDVCSVCGAYELITNIARWRCAKCDGGDESDDADDGGEVEVGASKAGDGS